MKKIFPLFLMIFILSLVLTGCSETTLETKDEEKVETSTTEDKATKEAEAKKKDEEKAKKAEESKKAEADKAKAEADKAKADADKKLAADKKAVADKAAADKKAKEQAKQAEEDKKNEAYRNEVLAYSDSVSETMSSFSENVSNFSAQTMMAGDDPTLMFDDTWIMDTALTLVYIQTNIDSINAMEAPKGFEEIQSYNLKIAEEWQFVVDNFPTAIDNVDTDLINECVTHIQQGTAYTDTANQLLIEKTEELQDSGVF